MRRSSCWMVLVALLTITAPTAFADSFSIVFTGGSTTPVDNSISFTLVPPTNGNLVLGNVLVGSSTFFLPGPLVTRAAPQNDLYSWHIDPFTAGVERITILDSSTGSFVIADAHFSTNFFDSGQATVTLNTVAAPEPSPIVLTLIGMGLLVVMRKRIAQGLPSGHLNA